MTVQFITDTTGLSSGVFISIKDWQAMKGKYHIKEEEGHISEVQFEELQARVEDYAHNPEAGKEWETIRSKYMP